MTVKATARLPTVMRFHQARQITSLRIQFFSINRAGEILKHHIESMSCLTDR